eukprot:Em0003g1729a
MRADYRGGPMIDLVGLKNDIYPQEVGRGTPYYCNRDNLLQINKSGKGGDTIPSLAHEHAYQKGKCPPQGQGYPQPGQGYPQPGQGYPQPGQGYPQQAQGYPQPGEGYPHSRVKATHSRLKATHSKVKATHSRVKPTHSRVKATHSRVKATHSKHGQGYPQQGQGYPQQGQGYPQQGQGYPQQGEGYPQQSQGYPQQGQGYPQQGEGYPQQGQGYPQGYPQQGQGYPQQGEGYSPQNGAYPIIVYQKVSNPPHPLLLIIHKGSHVLPTIEDFQTVPSPPSSHVTPEAAKSTSHSSQPATTKQVSTTIQIADGATIESRSDYELQRARSIRLNKEFLHSQQMIANVVDEADAVLVTKKWWSRSHATKPSLNSVVSAIDDAGLPKPKKNYGALGVEGKAFMRLLSEKIAATWHKSNSEVMGYVRQGYPLCYKFVHSWESGEMEEDGDRRRSRTSINA